jgi:hypothetical protein
MNELRDDVGKVECVVSRVSLPAASAHTYTDREGWVCFPSNIKIQYEDMELVFKSTLGLRTSCCWLAIGLKGPQLPNLFGNFTNSGML